MRLREIVIFTLLFYSQLVTASAETSFTKELEFEGIEKVVLRDLPGSLLLVESPDSVATLSSFEVPAESLSLTRKGNTFEISGKSTEASNISRGKNQVRISTSGNGSSRVTINGKELSTNEKELLQKQKLILRLPKIDELTVSGHIVGEIKIPLKIVHLSLSGISGLKLHAARELVLAGELVGVSRFSANGTFKNLSITTKGAAKFETMGPVSQDLIFTSFGASRIVHKGEVSGNITKNRNGASKIVIH